MHAAAKLEVTIREATKSDIDAIQSIYAHHVTTGFATFETEAPTVPEMADRWAKIIDGGMPYIVAEREGAVVGYAYVTSYRPRPAYRFTVENSVYVAPGLTGGGIGTALLQELLSRCEAGPWRQMIAVIGDSGNLASIALHRSMGFADVGVLKSVGRKFDQWVDTVLMQRELGDGAVAPPA